MKNDPHRAYLLKLASQLHRARERRRQLTKQLKKSNDDVRRIEQQVRQLLLPDPPKK